MNENREEPLGWLLPESVKDGDLIFCNESAVLVILILMNPFEDENGVRCPQRNLSLCLESEVTNRKTSRWFWTGFPSRAGNSLIFAGLAPLSDQATLAPAPERRLVLGFGQRTLLGLPGRPHPIKD